MGNTAEKKHAAGKLPGSVWNNNGYWYWSVTLPGSDRRRKLPLKMPGSDRPMRAEKPFVYAERAAWRLWEEAAGNAKRRETNLTVNGLCDAWVKHCLEYYRRADGTPTGSEKRAAYEVRAFRELFRDEFVVDLVHKDMLRLRDELIARGLSRSGVNHCLGTTRQMISWALDEALVPALAKAELTHVANLKPFRSAAHETNPVRPVDDETVRRTLEALPPNTADLVRVQRLTGMRPGEACALRWHLIDRSRTPWVYRPEEHKNAWRGQPRVVCIGPKAREILLRHGPELGDVPFSPETAVREWLAKRREERTTKIYTEKKKDDPYAGASRAPGKSWGRHEYSHAIARACLHAKVDRWGPNRLRHAFATEVRRKFGLEATRAVLGHSVGARVTDRYSFDALEDEIVAKAAPAVEALG